MGILLDPSKNVVKILVMYIEEIDTKHGNDKFYFIQSRDDLEKWKRKGYLTQDEFDTENQPEEKPGEAVKVKPDPNKIIKSLHTYWTRMNWKEQNVIYSRCLKQNTNAEGKTNMDLDGILYRDMKLKTCLKKWSLMDNGSEVPVNDANIDTLVPEVATELLRQFEEVTEASDDDLKN